jgi:RsmE family RNA methyltransferase
LFFRANRSQKLVISDKKVERLNKIIKEAAEQCGRNIIPGLII